MNFPLERSDDRRRGEMLHIRKSLEHVAGLGPHQKCAHCSRTATHVIDARRTPRAVCEDCAGRWRGLSPIQRHQARNDWARRG